MLKKIYIILFILVISLSLLVGCTSIPFFNETKLILNSYDIVDDDGFTSILLDFNISNKVTLVLVNPNGVDIFLDDYYVGNHVISIPLSEYRKTPIVGLYYIKAFDSSNNQIFNEKLNFFGYNLTFTKVIENWWVNDDINSLVGFSLVIKNSGDFPSYPHKLNIKFGDKEFTSLILPKVILPGETENLNCFFYNKDVFSTDILSFSLSVFDFDGDNIANSSSAIYSSVNLPSLEYTWRYNGNNRLIIPDVDFLYDYYVNIDRIILEDYTAYIFDIYDDLYIDLVADQLLSIKDISSDVSKINFIASFIQSLKYAEDDENDISCEYPRFPVEMLKDSKGDCEDKAMLTATLLDNVGFNVSLIRLPNHMSVGVYLQEDLPLYDYFIDKYYYLETTKQSWNLGRIPEDYAYESNVTVYPLSPHFILFHDWINATRYTSPDKYDYVKIKIVVENFGSKAANNFKITGAFFDLNDIKFNEEEIIISELKPGDKRLLTLKIDIPLYFSTSLKTQIYINGVVVNEKISSSVFP